MKKLVVCGLIGQILFVWVLAQSLATQYVFSLEWREHSNFFEGLSSRFGETCRGEGSEHAGRHLSFYDAAALAEASHLIVMGETSQKLGRIGKVYLLVGGIGLLLLSVSAYCLSRKES